MKIKIYKDQMIYIKLILIYINLEKIIKVYKYLQKEQNSNKKNFIRIRMEIIFQAK
jgi:hypothetical protein